MLFRYTLKTAFTGLERNRSRSALTILGIVIGIAAIILITSLGQGAQNLILNQIQGMGSKTIAILPGRQPKGFSDVAQIFTDSLKNRDLEALQRKENVPGADKVMPIVFGGDNATYDNNSYRLTIFGGTAGMQSVLNIVPSEGVFISDDDVRGVADVVVLGATVKEELFGASNALGEKIKIKNRNFRVIGILPKKGQVSFFNFDEMAMIPYTTAQQYIFGIKYFHRIIVEAQTEALIPQTVRDIQTTLRNNHNITDPDKDDFNVQTQADLVASISTITDVLTLFLVSVAAIALLVGGIGIMNIMLVSVTERTREIGLRKALGATPKDILSQFMVEAVLLTAAGGVVGITLGASLSFAIALVLSKVVGLNWNFTFPFMAALVGLLVSAAVGLIFGLYPARQASLKDPIEALGYE